MLFLLSALFLLFTEALEQLATQYGDNFTFDVFGYWRIVGISLGSLDADSPNGEISKLLRFLMRMISEAAILVFKPQRLKELSHCCMNIISN